MQSLEWSDLYKTHIAIVDEQHRQLFGMINDIVSGLEAGSVSDDEIDRALDGLVEYSHQHFVDEEREMVSHNVDARHQKLQRMEHNSYIYDLNRLRSYISEGSPNSQYEKLLEFTASWWIYHTLRTDQKLGMQVKAIQDGKSPAEAFEYAETHPLSPIIYNKVIEAVLQLWHHSLDRIAELEQDQNPEAG